MVCLSHGFGGRAKAMSKTARGCRGRRCRRARQHPAILPWPSISLLSAGPRPASGFGSLAAGLVAACAVRCERALFPARGVSTTDAEPLDQRLVAGLVDAPQIVEQLAALRHELEQAAPGMVVLDVGLEMLGQARNALREDRDLDFRRTGVAGFGGIILDDFRLAAGRQRHRASLF